mmetsp:Transcript_12656/g.30224  ORF Transcript_12656/g.30224 Transcript_12656/m.30224 type:complete len:250 (-) Transcript_12656:1054-1803(-)
MAPSLVRSCTSFFTKCGSTPASSPAILTFNSAYLLSIPPSSSTLPSSSTDRACSEHSTRPFTVSRASDSLRAHLRRTFCNIPFANRVLPVKTNISRFSNSNRSLVSTASFSIATLTGNLFAFDRRVLMPGTSPFAWSCHPPPDDNNCSTMSTAFTICCSSRSPMPTHLATAPRMHPARIELVPIPEPCGKREVVTISNRVVSAEEQNSLSSSWILAPDSMSASFARFRTISAALRRAQSARGSLKSPKC